jgi:hypothetical protein
MLLTLTYNIVDTFNFPFAIIAKIVGGNEKWKLFVSPSKQETAMLPRSFNEDKLNICE